MNRKKQTVETELESLQRDTFRYFLLWTNPQNGLVRDKTETDWPASIAATGLALASYPVAVERGFITRAAAIATVLATLQFFRDSPQGPESDATGHHGFYYYFLDMQTGRRAWQCELSTVDSAILLAGALTAGAYFDADAAEEKEIRAVADALYRRVDWPWAQNGGLTVTHGWKPESGFLKYRWQGYDEALVLYILGLGSPTLRCQRAATWRGLPLTSGKIAADTIIFTPGRCSRIKFRISGSIFVAFRTRSCAKKASTTSRTPAARLMRSNNMRSTTR